MSIDSRSGLAQIPLAETPLTRQDFVPAAEARWCPGCGDYAVLAAMQSMLPTLGVRQENVVIVSGIGCSSRFPYYMDTYGLHTIHGRAPAIATGIAMSRPDLSVWVVTGDGDALSIGGNHLIHALRRNVNMTIMLFNNRIYGLTKGQLSPTSETGKVTASTPFGSVDHPVNPVTLALGAEASFVGRALDSDRAGLTEVLTAAVSHRGAALVEIYQNCSIFNTGAFDTLKKPKSPALLQLKHGEPVISEDGSRGVIREADGALKVVDVASVGVEALLVHDAHNADASTAFALSQLTDSNGLSMAPLGIFRSVDRPVFDDEARAQVSMPEDRDAALATLLAGSDTWTVE